MTEEFEKKKLKSADGVVLSLPRMAANVWLKVDRFTHFAAAIETTPASCVTDTQEA